VGVVVQGNSAFPRWGMKDADFLVVTNGVDAEIGVAG